MTPYTTTVGRGSNKIDLLGQRFERLAVISQHTSTKGGNTKWLCLCDCGVQKAVLGIHLRNKNTRSCGCLQREVASIKCVPSLEKGYTKMPEYSIWVGIIKRCTNKNCASFKNYGGRGILVSESWGKSFPQFYTDMGPRPSKAFSVDRIDNNGNYSKENCRWATKTEQSNNTRRNVVFQGKNLKQWSVELGFSYATIWERFYRHGTPLMGDRNATV